MFHRLSKHLEFRQKYSAARRIFNSLLGVWIADETLSLVFDILHQKHMGLYREDICLQTLFLSFLNVQNVKQKNSLFHQPIVLWFAY